MHYASPELGNSTESGMNLVQQPREAHLQLHLRLLSGGGFWQAAEANAEAAAIYGKQPLRPRDRQEPGTTMSSSAACRD